MRRADWEMDSAFMAVALVAWPQDVALARHSQRIAEQASARRRMKLRQEGYRSADVVEEKIVEMQTAVATLGKRLAAMRRVTP